MPKTAIQIGHVNGKSGAAYEEATLKLVFPFVLERIRSAGIQADPFDGSLQNEPANNQYRYDVAIFLHCDSYSVQNTGFSIGYWAEQHPGSLALATILHDLYGKASGLPFIGYNITVGEWHYYGNRRFSNECRCALIELGFVSNPAERQYLQNNAKKLGYTVGDAVLAYLGVKPQPEKQKEEGMLFEQDGKTFKCEDLYTDRYVYWLHIRNDGAAQVMVDMKFLPLSGKPRKEVRAGGFALNPGEWWHGDIGNIANNDPSYKVVGSFALKCVSTGDLCWSLREIPK